MLPKLFSLKDTFFYSLSISNIIFVESRKVLKHLLCFWLLPRFFIQIKENSATEHLVRYIICTRGRLLFSLCFLTFDGTLETTNHLARRNYICLLVCCDYRQLKSLSDMTLFQMKWFSRNFVISISSEGQVLWDKSFALTVWLSLLLSFVPQNCSS